MKGRCIMTESLKKTDANKMIRKEKHINENLKKEIVNKNKKIGKKYKGQIRIKTYKDGHVIADYPGMDLPIYVLETRLQELEHRRLELLIKQQIKKLYIQKTLYEHKLYYKNPHNETALLYKQKKPKYYKEQYAQTSQLIWKKVGGYLTDAIKESEEKLAGQAEY